MVWANKRETPREPFFRVPGGLCSLLWFFEPVRSWRKLDLRLGRVTCVFIPGFFGLKNTTHHGAATSGGLRNRSAGAGDAVMLSCHERLSCEVL